MKEFKSEHEIIRQYLLGELSEAGRQQLEERVITDPEYKHEVLIVEDELLGDYVAGALSEGERAEFRDHYLSSPRQRQRLKIARALHKFAAGTAAVSPGEASRTSGLQAILDFFGFGNRFVQFSWAALLTLILIGGCWMFLRAWRGSQGLEQQLARLNALQSFDVSPDPSVLSVTLASLRFRGIGDSTRVSITPKTNIVQLRMPVTFNIDKYQTYRAALRITGGPEVFKFDGLRVRKVGQENILVLQIPANVLADNDYVLTMSGLNSDSTADEVGEYSFRVVTQQH